MQTQISKIKTIKVLFLIINLVVSIIAFSQLIAAAGEDIGGSIKTNEGIDPSRVSTPGTIPNPTGSGPNIDPGKDSTINDNKNNDGTGVGGNDGKDNGGGNGGNGGDVGDDSGGGDGGGGGWGDWNFNLESIIYKGGIGASIFGTIGSLAGGDNGASWGAIAGAIGGAIAGLTQDLLGEFGSTMLGLGVATLIFILTYKKTSKEKVEFMCLPWQAPVGGDDCSLCNDFKECSEYTCKSLGQACDIINPGSTEQKCVWKNPHDVNSPIISFEKVNKGHKFKPKPSTRPPSTGVIITQNNGECIKAYTPLEFTFVTDEPSQCKVDYNLTSIPKTAFDDMSFYVGGETLLVYNHTEKLSLPGPDAINAVAPELKNNGEYTLFIRCRDANGNFNQDAYSVSFCVEKGPDVTPPVIDSVNIPTGNPVQYNQTNLSIEVYVNEPSECKWSREDRTYDNMENSMKCSNYIWEMNNKNVYTCRTSLYGMENRKENLYYFRCKDQPWAEEGDRNTNKQSYEYKVIGTQPLNILSVSPNGTVSGSTDFVPVYLEIETDNGYKNGQALCYYNNQKPEVDEDYILFSDTDNNKHKQRQDLPKGNYTYYFKCVDLGGNTAYTNTSFIVDVDREAPIVVRVYKENSDLKILTSEFSECSYSLKDCNFEIGDGIKLNTLNYEVHTTEWVYNKNFYIRCKDKYDNQPNPNACSISVKPINDLKKTDEDTSSWDFSF